MATYTWTYVFGLITCGLEGPIGIRKKAPAKLYRKGRAFYGLRHTFETVGGESIDQVAVNAIMGHVDTTMAGHYRERISDERLKAVTDTIHSWLFGDDAEKAGE